jgi:hypothetical protein
VSRSARLVPVVLLACALTAPAYAIQPSAPGPTQLPAPGHAGVTGKVLDTSGGAVANATVDVEQGGRRIRTDRERVV